MSELATLIGAIVTAATAFSVLSAAVWKLIGEIRKQRRDDRAELERQITERLEQKFQLNQAVSTVEAKNHEIEGKEQLIVAQAETISHLEQRIESMQEVLQRQGLGGAQT